VCAEGAGRRGGLALTQQGYAAIRSKIIGPQMYITRLEIRNYKSFLNSGPVELKLGFNVITGQNNAGKTAFLEALSLRFAADPHRSLRTMPNPGDRLELESSVDISFAVDRRELAQALEVPDRTFYIPTPPAREQGS
jgi:hypothetical protein